MLSSPLAPERAAHLLFLAALRAGTLQDLGGSGSGNFQHEGRPGEVGGSGSGGSESLRSPTASDASRLKELKLPPAWKNVRISSDPRAALQATGVDVKGRTQYRYSVEHSSQAAAEKFDRLKSFNEALPGLRDNIGKDVSSKDAALREPAAVLQLIDKTGFRIGSDQDTLASKKAFGASTLESKHVSIKGDEVSFRFVGKKGVDIEKTVKDKDLARSLKPRVEAGGRLFSTTDSQVRDYMKLRGGKDFTPKDFRTWHGTMQAVRIVESTPRPKTEKEFKAAQREVAKQVSASLGNTPAVALASYIDPAVFGRWKK
jgi:DNA topoisomerase-1